LRSCCAISASSSRMRFSIASRSRVFCGFNIRVAQLISLGQTRSQVSAPGCLSVQFFIGVEPLDRAMAIVLLTSSTSNCTCSV
jgi:hypothetical protein